MENVKLIPHENVYPYGVNKTAISLNSESEMHQSK